MFAVINHLALTKPVDELQKDIEREGLPLLSSYPGFEDFYLVKVAEDKAIIVILWDSPANAQSGSAKFGPTWFAQNIAPFLASEQQRSVGQVVTRYIPDA